MNKIFSLPTLKQSVIVLLCVAVFQLVNVLFVGLRSEHFLMCGIFLLLFFMGKSTRKVAVALIPFIILRVPSSG